MIVSPFSLVSLATRTWAYEERRSALSLMDLSVHKILNHPDPNKLNEDLTYILFHTYLVSDRL